MEDESTAVAVGVFLLKKVNRLIAPVTARVEMMGRMIAVIEAEAVALPKYHVSLDSRHSVGVVLVSLTGTSMSVILDLKSESGSSSSTRAC